VTSREPIPHLSLEWYGGKPLYWYDGPLVWLEKTPDPDRFLLVVASSFEDSENNTLYAVFTITAREADHLLDPACPYNFNWFGYQALRREGSVPFVLLGKTDNEPTSIFHGRLPSAQALSGSIGVWHHRDLTAGDRVAVVTDIQSIEGHTIPEGSVGEIIEITGKAANEDRSYRVRFGAQETVAKDIHLLLHNPFSPYWEAVPG